MSSEGLHIPRKKLSQEARLLHNAVTSTKEELDAVDWYRQRADAAEDDELRQILIHNMREEMEHASMLLGWLRRSNSDFAQFLKEYLFTERPIVAVEQAGKSASAAGDSAGAAESGLTIGRLKGEKMLDYLNRQAPPGLEPDATMFTF